MTQREKIFKDINKWLLENHDHFPYTDEMEEDENAGEAYVLSEVFEDWLENYLLKGDKSEQTSKA